MMQLLDLGLFIAEIRYYSM